MTTITTVTTIFFYGHKAIPVHVSMMINLHNYTSVTRQLVILGKVLLVPVWTSIQN